MSILHYFSNDADKRAQFVFGAIAGIYAHADTQLSKGFWESTKVLEKEIGISGKTVLDVGSGSGAWASNFLRMGAAQVQGVDFVEKMVERASKKHPQIRFSLGNAENLSQFADKSFDMVTASFVLHGVKQNHRAQMLKEMQRIARNHVVIHDFIGPTPLFVRFLEFMERSDYKFFKENFCHEMKEIFGHCQQIQSRYGSGLYYSEISGLE